MSERNSTNAVSERNSTNTVSERNSTNTASQRNSITTVREQNDQDAATVLAVILALAGGHAAEEASAAGLKSVWNDPAHRLGAANPSPVAWWASAMRR